MCTTGATFNAVIRCGTKLGQSQEQSQIEFSFYMKMKKKLKPPKTYCNHCSGISIILQRLW